MRFAHLAIFPASAILGVYLWGELDAVTLLLPLALLNALAVRGLVLGRRFTAMGPTMAEVRRIASAFRRGVVFYGAAIGLLGFLLTAPADPAVQFPVIMLVAALSAGGITTQVAFPRAMHVFHVLALAPITLRMLLHNSSAALAVAGMFAVYGVGLTIVGRAGAQSFLRLSLLKVEKSRLADELAAARDQLAATNDTLDSRVTEVTERLAQANQLASLGQLAAGVAHEINNPLTWVISNSDYLRKHIEGAVMAPETKQRLTEAADDVATGGRRISAIVKDMTALAHDDVEWEPVDIHMILRRCARVAKKTIGIETQVELKLTADPSTVSGHASRLSQLFLNLFLNAAEAVVTADRRRIEVRTETVGAELLVSLKDSGPGIEAQPIERVFEPFYTTKRAGHGCGLGLSICRNIADEHNGAIAASTNSDGTTLHVRLPLAPVSEGPSAQARAVGTR